MTEETAEKAPAKRTPRAKTAEEPTLNIYQLISKISAEAGALAPEAKGGVPFAFRGVDAVVGHLAGLLQKYGVITVPEVLEHVTTQRELGGSKAITQTDARIAFHFYAPDGTEVVATTLGLAQDYADRSAAQAQSVAYRIALLQTFTLPTHQKEPEEVGEETQKYIEKANAENVAQRATAAAQATAAPAGPTVAELKGQIAAEFKAQGRDFSPKGIKAYGDEFYKVAEDPSKAGWKEAAPALSKLLTALKAEGAAKLAADTGADAATGEVA